MKIIDNQSALAPKFHHCSFSGAAYRCCKLEWVDEGWVDLPLEDGVPDGAGEESAGVEQDDVFLGGSESGHGIVESGYSAETLPSLGVAGP